MNQLCDIKVKSLDRQRKQEKIWGVKMTSTEDIFYKNMCKTPQIGYCSSFTDRQWIIQNKRKLKDLAHQKAALEKSKVITFHILI